MVVETEATAEPRAPLSRDRILRAAVALADREGLEALSMRKLADELGVKAMSLYNHVDNKEDLLNGMVDVLVAEIDLSHEESHWKAAARAQMLAARDVSLVDVLAELESREGTSGINDKAVRSGK